jgi:preprotein translocase subunit SecB
VVFAPAQIGDVWLASVRFEENDAFVFTGESRLTFQVEQDVEIESYEPGDESRGSLARLRLDLNVKWWENDKPATEAPFGIELAIKGIFTWWETPDEEIARSWLEYNGPYLLWPYARSYVATITGLGNLPTLTLQTLQVPELPDLESSEENAVPDPVIPQGIEQRSSEPV